MSNTGAAPTPQPFFLAGERGELFSLYFPPQMPRATSCGIVFFPPFAEEMNKARRLVAVQARRFAQAGFAVLLVDLYGTGDSAGDFGDARWELWRNDMLRAARWLQAQGCARLVLWGLRSGALLAAEVLPELRSSVERLLLWHPVVRGEPLMTQFLRLRLAADLMTPGEKITTQELRATLAKGESLEVAGYTLAPELVQRMDALDLKSMLMAGCPPLDWLDIAAVADRPLAPASRAVVDALQQQQICVRAATVAGEPFWNTLEITEVPELVERSTQWLDEACR
ncbi:MAG: hydrolase 2, exosortase A system-associated [Gammaproteobacteria bacterium]|nr:hydrolase 2, exosortase A system-associated [Gammaproteobacteria bacterium]